MATTDLLVTNNAYSTLASSITDSDLSMTVASGEGARFPAASSGSGTYFYCTLIDTSNNMEIVKVTNRSSDTFTITRAQDGTTARAYSSSDRVELRPTAVMFEEIRDSERTPIDGSVSSAKLADSAVTTAKINDGAVTFAKVASSVEATATEIRNGSGSKFVSPDKYIDSCAPVALTDATTVAIDWDAGLNLTVTLAGNRILGFPTNLNPGTWRRLEITQDATGSRTLDLTTTGYYAARGTAPTISTTANAVDVLYLYCRTSSIVEIYSSALDLQQIS